ncbi:hypothetical protein CNR22_13905 [Sphingobacteriaceae bacterium]|nr:hypothetical protein CNR22_13905 [Sphingobacteriaceae bacterium]
MRLLFLTLMLTFISSVQATVWKVGPTRTYTVPSKVAALVNSGDTVDIDAGVYVSDVCAWTDNNLLLRGINGMAHLKANGSSFGDKAIWVIQGNNITIEYVEFSQAASTSANGAGIRQEGKNVSLRHCYFHDNQNGILSAAVLASKITIEYCEFNLNGSGDGYTHNVYIGAVDTLLFRYNYSHHSKVGHELKTRAVVNYILYNRFSNETTGTGSYNIDVPNGGLAIIMGNVVQKGVNSTNSNLISYGVEALTSAGPHNLYLINNTLVNERSNGTFLNIQTGTALFKSYNNIFAGNGTLFTGNLITVDTAGNKKLAGASAGFLNLAGYDYHLIAGSAAINVGVNAGNASNGFALSPLFEYAHPAAQNTRMANGALDAGAYELAGIVSLKNESKITTIRFYVAKDILTVSSPEEIESAKIVTVEGKLIYQSDKSFTVKSLSTAEWTPGIYVITAYSKQGQRFTNKFIIP